MLSRYYCNHVLDHFILAYYTFQAPSILNALGFSDHPILALSIPVVLMVFRLLAAILLHHISPIILFHFSTKLFVLGTALSTLSFYLLEYQLVVFCIAMACINMAVTWENWTALSALTNSTHSITHTIANLSNITMASMILALYLSNTSMPCQTVFITCFLCSIAMIAFTSPITLNSELEKTAPASINLNDIFQSSCRYGLSYSTYAIPFVLMHHWTEGHILTAKSHMNQIDLLLMILDLVLMQFSAHLARKYYQKSQLLSAPLLLALIYSIGTYFTASMTLIGITAYKSLIIAIGTYYFVIIHYDMLCEKRSSSKIGSLCLSQWIGKAVFGKGWIPLVLLFWQAYHSWALMALIISLPAWITLTVEGTKLNQLKTTHLANLSFK